MAPISVRCPSCRARFSLARTPLPGRSTTCPECGACFLPPSEEDDAGTPTPGPAAVAGGRRRSSRRAEARYDDDWDDFERPRRRRPQSNNGLLIGLLIGGGVLVFLLVAGALAVVLALRGSGMRAQTKRYVPAVRQNPPAVTPVMRSRTDDYAQARARFHTRLVREIPAPQQWQVEVPPPDAREIAYTSGGLKLRAWVSSPPPAGTPKRPAVLFLHGGFAFGADDWEQAQPYRDAGYVVLIPMLRGENGLPGAYSMFYNEVDDVLAAADVLAGLPYVDRSRLYVAGHSVGGTLAMLASMTSTKFRAAASFSGSPDQEVWSAGQPQVIVFQAADEVEFQMRSPVVFPGSFKCPARLYYGSQEVFFRDNTEELARRARAAGRDVEAVQVPGGHLSMVDGAMRQSIRFFQQH